MKTIVKSSFLLMLLIHSFEIFSAFDNSNINRELPKRGEVNINEFKRNIDAPPLDINFFQIPKSITSLNHLAQPIVTRSGGQNIYKKVAPMVVKIVTNEADGSGIIISSDGSIITNWHVVRGYDTVGVILFDETYNPEKPAYILADVIKTDPKVDLALIQLQLPPKSLNSIRFGRTPEIGSAVHAIGHPFGEDWTYTMGYISQIRQAYTWNYYDDVDLDSPEVTSEHTAMVIQTQTPINPGNSGGPLINERAELIGINSFRSSGEGINFAVSISEVEDFIQRKEQEFGPIVDPTTFIGALDLDENGRDDMWGWDLDSDETVDVIAFDTDDDGQIDSYELVEFVDDDYITVGSIFPDMYEGRIEIFWLLDIDNDGEADVGGIDFNRDGRPDFMKKF